MTAAARKDGGKLERSWKFAGLESACAAALGQDTADAGVVKSLTRFAVGVVDAACLAERLIHVVVSRNGWRGRGLMVSWNASEFIFSVKRTNQVHGTM